MIEAFLSHDGAIMLNMTMFAINGLMMWCIELHKSVLMKMEQEFKAKRIHEETGVRPQLDKNGVACDPFNGQPIEACHG